MASPGEFLKHVEPFGLGEEYAAPGRVNLIGEHTDYSGGFVMPAAIDFRTVAALHPRADSTITIRSTNLPGKVTFRANQVPATARKHWSDYPIGVIRSLQQEGVHLGAFDLSISGNVPLGAGLSSSASIEVATAFALLSAARREMPLERIALLCQRAENGFVGTRSGIMDQFIACAGQQDHALLLDCRSLQFRLLPVPANVRLVISNSMVKHAHAGGEYNQRRDEVEEGTRILRRFRPRIELLRDATEEDLLDLRSEIPENVFRRCRHIVTENRRVELAAAALERGDLRSFGALMLEAHRSIRDDFQASCTELDTLVALAMELPGCYGARMTGGGFGGCTVNLVEEAQAESFREAIRRRYREATGIAADVYLCRASAGAGRVKKEK